MNTPLAPGVSALFSSPEDSLDYHEYFSPRLESNSHNDNPAFRLEKSSFDNNHDDNNHTLADKFSLLHDTINAHFFTSNEDGYKNAALAQSAFAPYDSLVLNNDDNRCGY